MPSNHTPGPWAFDSDTNEIFATDERYGCGWVAAVAGSDGQLPNDSDGQQLPECMRIANARLISAAPELLAALKDVCRFESVIEGMNPSVWPVIHAAIAKAEGRPE